MRLSKFVCVHIGGGVPGLDDYHMIIGVGLRIMGNCFRIIRIIIKRVVGELLDDKRRFLNEANRGKPRHFSRVSWVV